ncbi:DUF4222 domain-containing protein [Escherichia coli]
MGTLLVEFSFGFVATCRLFVVLVRYLQHNRVTFYRDGYQSPCVQPLARFMKEFAEVNKC